METFLSPGEVVQMVDGAEAAVDYFGFWNHCHDAEIREIRMWEENCTIVVSALAPMSPALDHFKRAVLTFLLRGISGLALEGFYRQNVLASILFYRVPVGLRMSLESSVGISGWIEAASIRLDLAPLASGR